MGDDRVCGIHYIPGRAIVTFKAYDRALRIILLEIEYVLDLRPSERIDRLAVIPHHADVPMPGGKLLQNQVLRIIRVLILIHKNMVEARSDLRTGFRIIPQEDVHIQEDVVEVHHSVFLQFLLVEFINLPKERLLSVLVLLGEFSLGFVGSGGKEAVLRERDPGQYFAWLVCFFVQF